MEGAKAEERVAGKAREAVVGTVAREEVTRKAEDAARKTGVFAFDYQSRLGILGHPLPWQAGVDMVVKANLGISSRTIAVVVGRVRIGMAETRACRTHVACFPDP